MKTVQKQKEPAITPRGKERLAEELKGLLLQRQEVNARLREEMQDKDDDFNRYLTHEELALIERRIAQIEEGLDSDGLEDYTPHGYGVAVGSQVTVSDEAGREQRLTIVTPLETDPARGFISFASPVGAALLGGAPGDEVTVPVPKGQRTLRIVRVE